MDINGTSGNDILTGTSSSDKIDGLSGNDILYGGAGNDTITSGPGFDYLYGEDGDDTLISKRGTGPDYFDGGAGIDRVNADFAKSNIELNADITDPSLIQYLGDGSSIVNVEALTITGGTAADRFIGGAFADSLNGYDGDDLLMGAGGNDTITGGNGYDTAKFAGTAPDYTITLQANGTWRVVSALEGTDILTGIENLQFLDGDLALSTSLEDASYWGTANGASRLVHGAQLPDAVGATAGTGFTITGLTRAADGSWWAANEGQGEPGDSSYTPSLVHLTADFSTKLGEIILSAPVRALQGLTYKAATGEIFAASLSERLVRVYGAEGNYIRSIAPTSGTSVNGLAYDSLLDAIIIGHENGNAAVRTIEWRSATTGGFIKSITVANEPDQLFFDGSYGTQGALYYSYGDSGAGRTGYVEKVDIATSQVVGSYTLRTADAIEGIYIEDDIMYVANDAYFHRGDPALNRVLTYEITPEAYVLDRRSGAMAFQVDLAVHDQVLADATHLVGVERLFFHGGTGNDVINGGRFADVIVGGGGNDILKGAGGDDRLVGGAGDDRLLGGAGNDGLDGGDGIDIAEFSGNRAQYSVTQLSATSVSISDQREGSPDGVDLLANIETFKFSDASLSFVQLLNIAPPAITISTLRIPEAMAPGCLLATLGISEGESYGFSLVDEISDQFVITGNSLRAGPVPLDYEQATSQPIKIRATAPDGSFVEQTFMIDLVDVNENPRGISIFNIQAAPEHPLHDALIANFVIDDPDLDPAFRDNQLSLNDDRFMIVEGNIYLKAGSILDHGQEPSISLELQSLSGNGFSISTAFQVDIIADTGEEDPETLTIALSSDLVAENSPAQTFIGILSASGSGTYSYILTDDDGGRFALAGSQLMTGLTPLDYETAAARTVGVQVIDENGNSFDQTFVINLSDVNEAPTGVDWPGALTSMPENITVGSGVKLADIVIHDDAVGDNVISLAGTDASSFEVRVSNGMAALYYVGASPDFESKHHYAVDVRVEDAGAGAAVEVVRTFILDISDVLEAGPSGPTEGDDRELTAIWGTALADHLYGLGGNDELYGLEGSDILDGGEGNDVLEGGLGADQLIGGSGSDTASYSQASAAVRVDLGVTSRNQGEAIGDTYNSIENIIGSSFNDNLAGTQGANIITGGAGDDIINGLGGADILYGGEGNDTLIGQGGNDRLEGGRGNDSLSGGGGGRDWFAYSSAQWDHDIIQDFEDGVDLLDFRGSGLQYSSLSLAQVGANLVVSGPNDSSITIMNLALAQVSGADFLFG